MTEIDNRDLSADDLLARCRHDVPVGAHTPAAIEAHRIAVQGEHMDLVQWLALSTVILSTGTLEDERAKLDYLASLPESAWPPSPAPFCSARDDQLMAIRRSIAWRMAG